MKITASRISRSPQTVIGKIGPATDMRFRELRESLREGERTLWRTGDLVAQIVAEGKFSVSGLSRRLNYPRIRLNEIFRTAEAFPPSLRRDGTPFYRHEQARKVARRFSRFGLTPAEALSEIVEHNLVATRAISRHFAHALQPPIVTHIDADEIVDRCHHCSFEKLAAKLSPASINLLYCDPPFLPKPNVKGARIIDGGIVRTDCDNADAGGALAVTLNVLQISRTLIASGGVLLLFQPAGLLDFRIHQAIIENKWDCEAELHWDKARTRPGSGSRPYSTQIEKILVLVPQGTRADCHGKPLHSDLLRFTPPSLIGCTPRTVHAYQKPIELCKFLLRQHTPKGGLVVDAFGCSGTMVQAAIEEERRWIYCESHRENFLWARQRILAVLATHCPGAASA